MSHPHESLDAGRSGARRAGRRSISSYLQFMQSDEPKNKSCEELTAIPNTRFTSHPVIFAKFYKFDEANQCEKEKAKEWAARVRALAVSCEFGPELEAWHRGKFIMRFEKSHVLARLLKEENLHFIFGSGGSS
ncbi:hypothetical protein HHI36_018454 [Cryptolaemus montrouzieri]|uniref:Uncharacterized protein n=1 Tax=Cryptolaemus montrouzieri TaxID=559131 RepID=A0ABD2P011_9CUCU